MFCRIYVFFSQSDLKAVRQSICEIIDAQLINNRYIEKEGYSVEVRKNDEYNRKLANDFPDGFLYFPYGIELNIDESVDLKIVIFDLNNILKHLWEDGHPAIASFGFEHLLLKNGGYKNPTIPWVN
jgi:hypothetical protein